MHQLTDSPRKKGQTAPPPDALTRYGHWTRTWAGVDPRVLAHFCTVSEAKEAARSAMHRSVPQNKYPWAGPPAAQWKPAATVLLLRSGPVPQHQNPHTNGETHPAHMLCKQLPLAPGVLAPAWREDQAGLRSGPLTGERTGGLRNSQNGLEVWVSAPWTTGVSPCERGITGWRRPAQGPREHRARAAPCRGLGQCWLRACGWAWGSICKRGGWNPGLPSCSPAPILWDSNIQSVAVDGSVSNTGQR